MGTYSVKKEKARGGGGPEDRGERFARVLIQLRTRSLDRPFDYLIPERLGGNIITGSIVLVRFGRQKALGVVCGLAGETAMPAAKLIAIDDVVDFPPIPEPLIRLALWIAEHYYSSSAAALALVLPPGGLPSLKRTGAGKDAVYTLEHPRVSPRVLQFARLATDGDGGATEAQRRLLEALSAGGEQPVSELVRRAGVSRSVVSTLERSGALEIFDAPVRRDSLRYYGSPGVEPPRGELELNDDQRQACEAIIARMREEDGSARSRPILLQGVAGAGKTEVYLQAIEAAVAEGGGAIVLVPEISLTHQAVKRFRRRFGERVGVIHSGLSPGERYDEYRRIRAGEVDVVIGPRSALLSPLPSLRLIVVDEENDGSFKQESDPRYDARRVALERARLEGVTLVYGSATPSLESYYRVRDRYILRERATGAAMPAVEIVDMRQEKDHVLSRRLVTELDDNLKAGGKSILLLNRRGFAGYLQCADCGHVSQCKNCDVSLTVHSRERRLSCHHCGYGEELPAVCPACGSTQLRRWGVGTERLEKEVRRHFPEAPVFRLDADTAGTYGGGPRILEEFSRTDRAILLGTQMVAKGHHYPEVTLAAVINADLSLQFPEFRAEEHTFALITQLAGRSGRAGMPGRVLVQTWNENIECIRMAADLSLEEFYQAELGRRRLLGYPPFVDLINIILKSRDGVKAGKAAEHLKGKLAPVLGDAKLLGPAELFRLKGWSRSHLLVKTESLEETLHALKPVLEHYREPYRSRGVRLVVDVDPQWLS
ncbi:MAG: primosomal protein N' [Gaiellales bacterium]|nr:MAG: primosomal protein N' [Gaiellales bacterium]